MRFVFLDFETFWNSASGYTLKKLSVEEYVRDPRFEVICLGAAASDMPVRIYDIPTPTMEKNIQFVLNDLRLNSPDTYTICQNYQFDGFILSEHYGIKVANPICNRALARWTGVSRLTSESLSSLNKFFDMPEKFEGTVISDGKCRADFTYEEWQRFTRYCADDVEQTREHFNRMYPLLTEDALRFISLSELMYTQPRLELNAELLQQYETEILDRQERAMNELQRLFQFQDRDAFIKAIRSPK